MSLVSFSYTTVFCKQVNTGYFLISFSLGNSRFPVIGGTFKNQRCAFEHDLELSQRWLLRNNHTADCSGWSVTRRLAVHTGLMQSCFHWVIAFGEEASMAVLTDAEARRMLELLKEALSPKSITLNKGEKQFQLHQISL